MFWYNKRMDELEIKDFTNKQGGKLDNIVYLNLSDKAHHSLHSCFSGTYT